MLDIQISHSTAMAVTILHQEYMASFSWAYIGGADNPRH